MWMFTLRWCHLEGESLDNDLNSVDSIPSRLVAFYAKVAPCFGNMFDRS